MPDLGNRIVSYQAVANSLRGDYRPRVLITGACSGFGRDCAEALSLYGAELILCDKDRDGVCALGDELGATGLYCDVASEAGVLALVAEVLGQNASLDMIINAAGGGYERTLGMYRVSRALLPALRQDGHTLLVNVPPSSDDGDKAIFPYASSAFAFHRLSAALAFETRGTPVRVLIGCPATGRVTEILPDPNAGRWADSCNIRPARLDGVRTLARQVAALLDGDASIGRLAS